MLCCDHQDETMSLLTSKPQSQNTVYQPQTSFKSRTVLLKFFIIGILLLSHVACEDVTLEEGQKSKKSDNRTRENNMTGGKMKPHNSVNVGVGVSKVVPKEEAGPTGVHMSVGENPYKERIIMWTSQTKMDNFSIAGYKEYIQYLNAESYKLNWTSDAKWIHRVVLNDLKPNHKYWYSIGNQEFKFYTWIHRQPMEFLFYGSVEHDGGEHSAAHSTLVLEVAEGHYSGVVNLGSLTCQQQTLPTFLGKLQDISARTPYLATQGQWEKGSLYSLYPQLFSFPGTNWPPMNRMWYSFDTDDAHIISLSSEVYFTNNMDDIKAQREWLENDLQKANSHGHRHILHQPWVIVYLHRSLYCSGDQQCGHDSIMVRDLEDIFYHSGVDLVISTQENFYERTKPVYRESVQYGTYNQPRAPIYISTAAFSCDQHKQNYPNPGRPYYFNNPALPEWTAKRVNFFGTASYGRFRIHNATHVRWIELSADDQSVVDTVWIVQNNHGPFYVPIVINPIVIAVVIASILVLSLIVVLILIRRKIKNYYEMKKAQKSMTYTNLNDGNFDL